jgi:hypothetical protein
MKKIIILLVLIFGAVNASASIKINISIIQKKGVNKGLVLVSEYHTVEEIDDRSGLSLELKNGIKFEFSYQFVQESKDFGPSDTIRIKGRVWELPNTALFTFIDQPITIRLGEAKNFSYTDEKEGKLTELVIRPELL